MQKFKGLTILLLAGLMIFTASAAFSQAKRYRVGYKDSGFSMIGEVAALLPSNTYPTSINFNVIGGMMVNSHIFVGGGVALDAYSSDIYVPVFADARYYFLEGIFTPFAMLDVGYGIPVEANPILGGGIMANPGFGLKYFMSRTIALNASLGYRYQSMPITLPDGIGNNPGNNIQSFSLRVGLQF